MGRTLKRVPMDFAWPLNKLWDGYLNPHSSRCPEDNKTCFGGWTAAGKWPDSVASLLALLGEQAAETPEQRNRQGIIFPHPYLREWGQAPSFDTPASVRAEIAKIPEQSQLFEELTRWHRENPRQLLPLTDELNQLVSGLYGSKVELFHGSGVSYTISEKIKEAAGVPDGWGVCPVCEGHGDDPSKRAAYEAWKPTEPPEGEGFQLWETTSEGSPVSPVFATLEKLCAWCENNATTFGSFKSNADEWRKMLGDDFVHHKSGNAILI